MKTSSATLQAYLEKWLSLATDILASDDVTSKRRLASEFVDSFAPKPLPQDDVDYFTGNIVNDEEYLRGMVRDLEQCSLGDRVESILGDQVRKAIFTVLGQGNRAYG